MFLKGATVRWGAVGIDACRRRCAAVPVSHESRHDYWPLKSTPKPGLDFRNSSNTASRATF